MMASSARHMDVYIYTQKMTLARKHFSLVFLLAFGITAVPNSAFSQQQLVNPQKFAECEAYYQEYLSEQSELGRVNARTIAEADEYFSQDLNRQQSASLDASAAQRDVENCVNQYLSLVQGSRYAPANPAYCVDASAYLRVIGGMLLPGIGNLRGFCASVDFANQAPNNMRGSTSATSSAPSNNSTSNATRRPTTSDSSRAASSESSNSSTGAVNDNSPESGVSDSEAGFTQTGSGELISLRECISALEQHEQAEENDNSRDIVSSCTNQYAEDVLEDPSVCPQALEYARSSNEAASSRVLIRGTCRSAIVRNIPAQNRRSSGEVSGTIAIESPNNQFPPALW